MTQTRYSVSYLSWELAKKRIVAAGEDPDYASIWDHCEEHDIEVYRKFKTRAAAVKWAKANNELDIFSMPRIREETYGPVSDDLGNPEGCDWTLTGHWEVDGAELNELAS